jgi:nucleoside-diphosphate-sugar epimerase
MDALGAERIPDPTTAGDFTRRFSEDDVCDLLEAVNSIRPKLWKRRLSKAERKEALVDIDGTHAPTWGECKQGIGLSYDGKWCYHPLLVSLANTMEPLYLVNRPGNSTSHDGAVEWIDRAIGMVRQSFKKVCLRGDTDFALTVNFDRWSKEGVRFAFGIDAMKNLVEIAEGIDSRRWRVLRRREKEPLSGKRRKRPKNFKEEIVVEKGYRNIRLEREHVSEFSYRPRKCKRSYRVIVLRKSLSVEEGQVKLWDDIRYFFYITNRTDLSAAEVVWLCNERCNQENLIEQLKNGLSALRMPVDNLVCSFVAICGDNADMKLAQGGIFTEKDWNVTSRADHQPYCYAKTIAEKEAWAIAKEQDQWDLVTINPGWVLGPSISKRRDSMSIGTMIKFGDGTYKMGVPEIWNPIVDVRDVASAHIKAGFTPSASGRHIIASREASLLDLANILRKHVAEGYPLPRRQVPKVVFWLMAPMFDFNREYASRNVGYPVKFDNSYSKADLGMTYIPIEQTLKEHFQQILDDGLLKRTAGRR